MTTAAKSQRVEKAGAATEVAGRDATELEKELSRDIDAMMEQIAIESDRLIERRKERQEAPRGAFGLRITY